MMEEMECDQYYFYDRSLGNCISCKDTCNPYRTATENECRIHCAGYLHSRNQFTTADDREFYAANSSQTMVLITVLLCGILGFCTLVVICSAWLIFVCKKFRKKGHYVEKSVATDIEAEYLNYSEVQKSSYNPSKYISSSLCQESDNFSNLKATDILIESPPRSIVTPSTGKVISQETEAEGSQMAPTRPKETDSASVVLQHQNVSTSPRIDLHEDFDCVEQAYDLTQRGHDAVLSNFSCDNDGMKNLRISAVLQRLAWVKQFWWDVEGAKVVVDESRHLTAKDDIQSILEREGIPPSEFSFELVNLQRIVSPYSGSTDSELNS